MSLHSSWTDMVIEYVKQKGDSAFWKEYGAIEKSIYTKILSNHTKVIEGTFLELASHFNVEKLFFMGFLDGINDSLVSPINMEEVEEDTFISLSIDYDKLYFNMLDAKADYLYKLPQWDGIFSMEKRKEILLKVRESKTVTVSDKIGRNDPCPCGSGKKYKKCCGK